MRDVHNSNLQNSSQDESINMDRQSGKKFKVNEDVQDHVKDNHTPQNTGVTNVEWDTTP